MNGFDLKIVRQGTVIPEEKMKNLNIQIDDKIHNDFREYSKSQERSMKSQLVWMVKEAVKNYIYEEKRKEKEKSES